MLGTALMDMYLKCRMVTRAQEVHDQLSVRDAVSWSALIAGYAQQGQGHKALECFAGMQSEGVRADVITFLSILNACNRTGLSDEATAYYYDISSNHGIVPGILHHIHMVSMFACIGSFDQAVSIIRTLPSSRFPPLWLSLLGGCKRWGNIVLGRSAFDQLMQLDKSCSASGMREDATKIEEAMKA
jgi:pentatricopeptide repeat protein